MKKLLLEFRIVEKKDRITIFAYSEGKRVGYIQFSPSLAIEKQLVVKFIHVDEKWRGKRIAERLLKNAGNFARQHGFTTIRGNTEGYDLLKTLKRLKEKERKFRNGKSKESYLLSTTTDPVEHTPFTEGVINVYRRRKKK